MLRRLAKQKRVHAPAFLRWLPLTPLACGCLALAEGCHDKSELETSVVQAKQIYDQRDPETDVPPAEVGKQFSPRKRKRFADDMVKVVHSSYRDEALYSLGWFGERKHARVIAPHLASDDRETRRVAFNSFSRLVGREFQDASAARKWWQKEKGSFNTPPQQKGFDWFGLAPKKSPQIP